MSSVRSVISSNRVRFRSSSVVFVLLLSALAITDLGATWSGQFAPPPGGSGLYSPTLDQVMDMTHFRHDLVVSGDFEIAGNTPASNIAVWNGTAWSPLGAGLNAAPASLAVFRGELVAAGFFTSSGTTPVAYIARWDGSSWQPLGSGLNDFARSLAVYGDRLIVGGKFTTAGGVSAPYLAAWDGSSWSAVGDFDGRVECLAVSGGFLYAGGMFDTVNGQSAPHIARWDGASWTSLGTGTNGRVRCIALYDGKLVAGGFFASAGGSPASNVAWWDGSSWSPLGSGVDNEVFALTHFRKTLVAGGSFANAGGAPASRVARWDGSTWGSLGGGLDDTVDALLQADGHLFVGGRFSTAGGLASNCIAQWDDAPWSPLTYFVNPAGEGDFPTINWAADAVGGGETVEAQAGAYEEDVSIRNKWFTLSAPAGRDQTTIRSVEWLGTGWSSDDPGVLAGFSVLGSTNVEPVEVPFRLEHCRFHGAARCAGHGDYWGTRVIGCDLLLGGSFSYYGSATYARLENSRCVGGVTVASNGYPWITGCELEGGTISVLAGDAGSLTGSIIRGAASVQVFGNDFVAVASGNTIRDSGPIVVECPGGFGEASAYGNTIERSAGLAVSGSAVDIHGNRVVDGSTGVSIGGSYLAELAEADNNILIRCRTGIAMDTDFTSSSFTGNTIVDCAGPGIESPLSDWSAGLSIANNLVVGCDQGISLTGPLPSDLSIRCNDVWNNPGGNWFGIVNPTGTDGNISTDPFFCAPSIDDFSLASDSPCAPAQQPTCGLIGALGVGCGVIAEVPETDPEREPPEETGGERTQPLARVPNPLRPGAQASFELPAGSGEVRWEVFDLEGRLVAAPIDGRQVSGPIQIVWTGRDLRGRQLPAGVYLWRLTAGETRREGKSVVLP